MAKSVLTLAGAKNRRSFTYTIYQQRRAEDRKVMFRLSARFQYCRSSNHFPSPAKVRAYFVITANDGMRTHFRRGHQRPPVAGRSVTRHTEQSKILQ